MSSFDSDAAAVATVVSRQLYAAAEQLDELDEATRAAGGVVLAAARPPRRSGAMAAGQTVYAMPGGVGIVSTVRYWTFVHFGAPRAGVRAQPWLSTALTVSADEVAEVYAAHAQSALNNVRG